MANEPERSAPDLKNAFGLADALETFQRGPKIPRPNLAESFIPVVGPAWEAVGDLQDGDYGGAALNGAFAVADALPIGVAAKGIRAATKGIGLVKKGSKTADAARKMLKRKGFVPSGYEVHHTRPLNGLGRNVEDVRNNFMYLKVLPKEQHRRLTGTYYDRVAKVRRPKYGPVRRLWYGTTDWQKAFPAGFAGYSADVWENLNKLLSSPRRAPQDETAASDGRRSITPVPSEAPR